MEQKFVSAGHIDEQKRKKKAYLEEKLKKAQSEFEASKIKKELKRSRGDAEWMLPSLSSKIETMKKKKKKHKKKKKKEKKRCESWSENENSEDDWEESTPIQRKDVSPAQRQDFSFNDNVKATSSSRSINPISDESSGSKDSQPREREEWMSSMFDVISKSTTSRENKTKQRKLEEKRVEEEKRKKIHESRELNPYWKNGGSGLPQLETETKEIKSVGDAGKGWLEKAYKRAEEQARDEGVPIDEIIKRRWGSMEKFNALRKLSQPRSVSGGSTSRKSWRKNDDKMCNPKEDNISTDSLSTTTKTAYNSEEGKISIKEDGTTQDESSDSESEDEVVVRDLSEKEKNEISAKILRAELMGNDDLCEQLKAKLASGKVRERKRRKESEGDESGDDEQIIMRSDKHGNLYPLKQSSDYYHDSSNRRKMKKKVRKTHDEKGERTIYFENDAKTTIKSMVEEERLTSAADNMAMMSKLTGKMTSQSDDYTLDDEFIQVAATKGLSEKEAARKREKAIIVQRRQEEQLNSCRYCFNNSNNAKHLIIAIGQEAYLALPMTTSLTESHCLIIPRSHVIGQTYFDEDVIEEVTRFKQCLANMFHQNDEDVVFMETCKNLRYENHTIIDCIPVPREVGDTAPIYFKKALLECESEWSQNKKVVDIKPKSSISKSIPKGLPYFAVEFGTTGGYAHVLEDESSFPSYFGKEIIGGILDLEPRMWRKPPKESFEKHKRKVLKFADQWKKFDFT